MILKYCIVIFITQLIFIGARTWNVKAIANHNVKGALFSGGIVHIAWLISIAIGSVSMYELIGNWNYSYIPVVVCSLAGGLIGTYVALMDRFHKDRKGA